MSICDNCDQETDVIDTHQKYIEDTVNHWNWNYNIFEIYDDIKDLSPSYQSDLLSHALKFFTMKESKKMIVELADHLCVDLNSCEEED